MILSTQEPTIIEGALGTIVTTVIKAYLDTALDPQLPTLWDEGDSFRARHEEEKEFLNFIKAMLVTVDNYP